ncbi:hypothetical protein G1H11_14815 [Phytoactinopolyspora alkaliphila]|uniref:Trypsin-like serine protease n=1 Tax=Phytoactinopolyspora alkaliphila TaxID=1783498 RepID=A0A6N9YNS0_9ACTN|nr:hypothetical protein [Phytoactinopolyspora alkaliphila]NED96580.1 hypothetical protein [Phytoactinopolyspora alkaliphila]
MRIPNSALTVRVKSLNRSSGGGVVQVSTSKVRANHGPLVQLVDGKRSQVGLTSSGDSRCTYGNYSSTPASLDWIRDVMARF